MEPTSAAGDEPDLRVAASVAGFRTRLVFAGTTPVDTEQFAAVAAFEKRLSRRWTLSASAGGVFSGQLVSSDRVDRLGPGGVVSVGASWTWLEQQGARPFVMLSGSLALSAVQTTPTLYAAGDARLGVAAGYTLWDRVTPYATARVFGGPVFWNHQTGTDAYHVQLGAGLVVGLPAGFDLSAELVPLGEQRLTAALGFSW